jgi:hypothetical protein
VRLGLNTPLSKDLVANKSSRAWYEEQGYDIVLFKDWIQTVKVKRIDRSIDIDAIKRPVSSNRHKFKV